MARRLPKKYSWTSLLVLAISLLITYGTQQGWFGTAPTRIAANQPGYYSVTRFSDGDTIVVNMNGTDEKVRFVGVDTPETHKPNAPVQCYGPAASAHTKNLIGTQKVRLESDPLSTDRDRYNRLLRYVYLADGTLVNQELIEGGYGFYYPYFPFSKSTAFAASQATAKAANKGLWGNCTPTATDKGGYISNNL